MHRIGFTWDEIISIHAPTRGATMRLRILSTLLLISIHAPTRGATFAKFLCQYTAKFQSTLLQEERRQWLTLLSGIK